MDVALAVQDFPTELVVGDAAFVSVILQCPAADPELGRDLFISQVAFTAESDVSKSGISQRALNRIKRLAAFSNPLFYKTQAMRMSTFGIPRIIYSLDETADYMGIPRGCRNTLVVLLESAGVSYLFEDKRNDGKQIDVNFTGTLREEQLSAADALL